MQTNSFSYNVKEGQRKVFNANGVKLTGIDDFSITDWQKFYGIWVLDSLIMVKRNYFQNLF